MPVVGTPIDDDTGSGEPGVLCSEQSTVGPRITQLYNVELPTKRRAVLVNQGQEATVVCTLFNRDGNPIDLTTCGIFDADVTSALVKIREAISIRPIYTIEATVQIADEGLVLLLVPDDVFNNPGVYHLEVAVLSDTLTISFSNSFYLWVDRGLFGDPRYPQGGPPSLDDIRLCLRDNAPEENRLIDDFEYDLAEVCHSAVFTCRYWNECQPPVNVCFNTMDYPAKERWMTAICGHLFTIASNRFRRNHLPYQAGGMAIDDQNKFLQYEQIGLRMMQDYREWVKQKKVAINCMAAMTSTGSSYSSFFNSNYIGI